MNKSAVVAINQSPQALDTEPTIETLTEAQKVSVITADGYEMVLDDYSWLQSIVDNLHSFTITPSQAHAYTHTLIIRTDYGNPLVMRISDESMTIADQTYTSDILPNVMLDIKGSIGKQMLSDLSMEQATVFMLDAGNQPLAIATEEMLEIKNLIRSAKFIHESIDIRFPLFPNYVIQVFNGDKSVISLDVISNNIISIPYGKDHTFYYHLDENIYERFYRLFPPFDYLDDHPKSLFAASSIEIIDAFDNRIQFGIDEQTTLIDDAITDSFARLLADGIMRDSALEGQKEEYLLTFYDSNVKKVVHIFADSFMYKDKTYYLRGVSERVHKHLRSLSE